MSEKPNKIQTETTIKEVIKQIEKKTEKIIIEYYQNTTKKSTENDSNLFQNIMNSGAQEFKEKIGRDMTYSEMREMYG
jgi:dissimilatory sulfite reductase (desulfoviridin) alpha/beta subunit